MHSRKWDVYTDTGFQYKTGNKLHLFTENIVQRARTLSPGTQKYPVDKHCSSNMRDILFKWFFWKKTPSKIYLSY